MPSYKPWSCTHPSTRNRLKTGNIGTESLIWCPSIWNSPKTSYVSAQISFRLPPVIPGMTLCFPVALVTSPQMIPSFWMHFSTIFNPSRTHVYVCEFMQKNASIY
jgi:hypothetical protein